MRHLAASVLLLLLWTSALGNHAWASLITFGFSGTVTGITDQSLLPELTGGSVFSGTYTFDESAPDQRPIGTQGEYLFGSPFQLTLNIGGLSLSQTLTRIIVFDSLPTGTGVFVDVYGVRSDGATATEFATLNPTAIGLSPSLIVGDALPLTPPDLALVTQLPNFQFFTDGLGIVGNLDSLCLSFPGGGATGGCFPGRVPEPSTLALLTIGLVGLGWMGRRRKVAA